MRLLLGFMLTLSAAAQTPRVPLDPKPVYGSVSGIITCTDTNLPARLTELTLQPVSIPRVLKNGKTETQPLTLEVIKTGLDGSYTMDHVKPGTYYVVILKPGYLSPVALFTREEIENPSDAVKDAIAHTVPTVTIEANRASTLDIRLQRAASLSGTIRYDDGTAVPQQFVKLQRKDSEGKWITLQLTGASGRTDDLGHYRISGIPAGSYRMQTNLQVEESRVSAIFGNSRSSSSRDKFSLPVYFGDTFWPNEARIDKLEDGQDVTENLTIPITRLHAVSGSLVEASTGKTINAGLIRLFRDGVEVVSTTIQDDENTFSFPFVPEGVYTVKVADAREVTRVPIVFPEGTTGFAPAKETVIKTYGAYEGALTVQTDLTAVLIPIPARGAP